MAAAPSFAYKYISHPFGTGQMSARTHLSRERVCRVREKKRMVGSLKTPMVLLEAALCPRERKASPSPPRKRKWVLRETDDQEEEEQHLSKELKLWNDDSIDLHLDTPLPPEWQRCLDIRSGKIHFYNTRTQRRTSKDPRRETAGEPPAADLRPARLNLELNLTCESSPSVCNGGEMVAAVCGRCYMLVMMSRSSPSCPNCKFSPLPEDMPLPKPAARALVL